MAKTLEEYQGEIANSYVGTRGTLEKQLSAIQGNLDTTQGQINKQYANQQAQLMNTAAGAANAASMRAAGNGGSFGGKAAIANQKYYSQSFAPAMMQSQTNQAQDIENARVRADQNRMSLEGQLASLEDTIAQNALNRFYSQQEADRQYEIQQRQLALQQATQAQSNAYLQYMMQAAQEARDRAAALTASNNNAAIQKLSEKDYGNDGLRVRKDYNPNTGITTNTIFAPVESYTGVGVGRSLNGGGGR